MAASTTTSADHAQEELDARLDVSVLKELARKSLVDSLNAVRLHASFGINMMLTGRAAYR
jgi:hypothetical protein